MKKYLQIILIAFCFVIAKVKAQCTNPITFSIQVTPPTCSVCCDGSGQVLNTSGGCAPYLIQWSTTPTQYGLTATGLCSGSYSVTIYDSGCCPSSMQICSVPQGGITGFNQLIIDNTFQIYPNPNNGNFILSIYLLKAEVKIYNVLGQEIDFNTTVLNSSTSINIPDKTKGIYFIEISNNDNLFRKKIIIE